MNIIRQYEFGLLPYSDFSEEIWGYGQLLINEVGERCFSFYIDATEKEYYIYPYREDLIWKLEKEQLQRYVP